MQLLAQFLTTPWNSVLHRKTMPNENSYCELEKVRPYARMCASHIFRKLDLRMGTRGVAISQSTHTTAPVSTFRQSSISRKHAYGILFLGRIISRMVSLFLARTEHSEQTAKSLFILVVWLFLEMFEAPMWEELFLCSRREQRVNINGNCLINHF